MPKFDQEVKEEAERAARAARAKQRAAQLFAETQAADERFQF